MNKLYNEIELFKVNFNNFMNNCLKQVEDGQMKGDVQKLKLIMGHYNRLINSKPWKSDESFESSDDEYLSNDSIYDNSYGRIVSEASGSQDIPEPITVKINVSKGYLLNNVKNAYADKEPILDYVTVDYVFDYKLPV